MVSAASSSSSLHSMLKFRGMCEARQRTNVDDTLLAMAHHLPLDTPDYNKVFSGIFKANPHLRVKFLMSPGGANNLLQRAKGDLDNVSKAWKKALSECGEQKQHVDIHMKGHFLRNRQLIDVFMALKNSSSIHLEDCIFEPGAEHIIRNILTKYLPALTIVQVSGQIFKERNAAPAAASSANTNGTSPITQFQHALAGLKLARGFLLDESLGVTSTFQDILRSLVGSAEVTGALSFQSYLEREGIFNVLVDGAPAYTADDDVNIALHLSRKAGALRPLKFALPAEIAQDLALEQAAAKESSRCSIA